MQSNNNILKELEELNSTLANIPRRNVFSAPEGYFEALSGEILLNVSKPSTARSVPEGYFDSLAGQILSKIKSSTREEDVQLEMQLLLPTIAGIGNNNVFHVPLNYFSVVEQRMAVQAETAAISTALGNVGKRVTYTVPEGYFEQLTHGILAKIKTPAKVVSMKPRFAAWRYAAAAAITAVMAVSVWFALNNKEDSGSGTITAAVQQEAAKILVNNNFEQEMSTVSDAAIVEFLESKGQNVEAALVASYTDVADDSKLPDATDYMINENTLDELLETLQLND